MANKEEHKFELVSKFDPKGDQVRAIGELTQGILDGKKEQVLLGATGTGKTFTVSQVIAKLNRPTLVFVHNKTLAGQLYSEFKEFFPNNRVEYFVSNFDYYQPEAYLPGSDTYIEKSSMINQELDMLRHAAQNSVLQRRDTIIVASVASIYATADPSYYKEMLYVMRVGQEITREDLMRDLVKRQYIRNDIEQSVGTFRVRGDVIEVVRGDRDDIVVRVEFFGDEIDRIVEVDRITGNVREGYLVYDIFPANQYARDMDQIRPAADRIEAELHERLAYFESENKLVEHQRLKQRTEYDLEALREFGMCSGVENYSMHIDGRDPNQRPYTLFDYFPDDYLFIVDESHVSLPQVRGMYNGDQSRKRTLVEYGFRLPSAMNNRPMTFEEFTSVQKQTIYVSATPGDYELEKVNHQVVEQIIRPTGLLDPTIEIKKSQGQVDDLIDQILERRERDERVLITTLTVKMAQDLTNYLLETGIKVAYLHHETKTLERIEILRDLRLGKYDVVVGINLLREGLDLPEVSLIAILDADKEGFLRSYRSLVQIVGRAARNSNGHVIMYADRITDSMKKTIDETKRRRDIQIAYNEKNGITPQTIKKEIRDVIAGKETAELTHRIRNNKGKRKDKKAVDELIQKLEKEMREAAALLDFERAAQLRDIVMEMKASL
ncbi:excinuclease ABC subunit UvrB [Erysipelothrix rhusiopathiae]|uniref:UvrABC system protein B n=1 Tax=Erysipelothrix rhusiopathiae ATCC 19414 TaxID=525280 RepID=E7FX73_ERYRH|nr:excinuclease ABC subunit UvrB [Erysipelothrix rhusiopathiae]AYV33974.1 excinuclease ABC subunit UvrB [Erysipelothrix rhusiopathiae]EFY08721.1 excinuclease ABC, B subunit [Erysipelothrix rhusiopathiae ATCC 19414]MDE8081577.1 excinuclease ABC subunit UvrB [Erysipelothrix rhusiopathiae]MDE8313917.1 excinuclease ABC subunit UvrB [Erysipelothrix rhusiopathiae]MDE8332216.1 excinuclease ABC subunit UvrB [Erysipelothrix rhusiopathiae]